LFLMLGTEPRASYKLSISPPLNFTSSPVNPINLF
jgi:hypothetical protein